jgi:muramidase (phage lysozyme)
LKAGVSVGAGFAQGLLSGDSLTNILGSFTKMKDWVGGALGSVFEIHSPSEWSAREVGEPLGEGIGVGLVRRFSGFMQGEGADSIKDTLEALLNDPRIQALLKTIETAEGGAPNRIVGGRTFNDLSRHPNIVGLRTSKGPSTAAGSYQITGTNWRKLAPLLGLGDFGPHNQALAALAIMLGHPGGMSALQSGDINRMMQLAAKDWTSTPGSTIGGGGQWSRSKWVGTYQSMLGGGAPITRNNPMPVTIVRDIIGGSSAERDTGPQFSDLFYAPLQDVGEAVVNITANTRELLTTARDFNSSLQPVMRTINPLIAAQYELATAQDGHARNTIALTKEYQEAARDELIKGESVLTQLSGMLGQIVGMIPGQQVSKKRGLFSKILGFAAPFLSFIPGVGPLLSTLVGAASGFVGGNISGGISAIAGGLQPGGVFRSGSHTLPTSGTGHEAHRAFGGPVYRGRPYIVGERRPELFVPNHDGWVHPSVGGGLHPQHAALIERLAAALDRFESMPAHEVVTKGARGLTRALDRNAGLVEGMGRRLNLS